MMDLADEVRALIAEQLSLPPERVVDDARFVEDLGADSLDLVELVMAAEEKFGIEVPDEDVESLLTVGMTVEYFQRRNPGADEGLATTPVRVEPTPTTTVAKSARPVRDITTSSPARDERRYLLCYSKQNTEWVDWVADQLLQRGTAVYLHEYDGKEMDAANLVAEIRRSHSLLIFLNPNNAMSSRIGDVVSRARTEDCPVLAVCKPGVIPESPTTFRGVDAIEFDFEEMGRSVQRIKDWVVRNRRGHDDGSGFRVSVNVDVNLCSGCELCISSFPKLFALNNDTAQAIIRYVPEHMKNDALQAADDCPTSAIQLHLE